MSAFDFKDLYKKYRIVMEMFTAQIVCISCVVTYREIFE